MNAIVTMPVYNDWQAASLLCAQLANHLEQGNHTANVLLLDDGSSVELDRALFLNCCNRSLPAIHVLRLGRNLGHQRAVAIGLTYVQQNLACEAVVVMDADGEDRAQDVPLLLNDLVSKKGDPIVFAERGRRIEGILFKTGYLFYRVLHRLATGRGIRVGNFSAVPYSRLRSLVVLPELWNHYAAAVIKARMPTTTVLVDRGRRLHGQSKMSFVTLVIHGLSALFAHHELVGTRIFVSLLALTLLLLVGVACIATFWAHRGWSIPVSEMIAMATAIVVAAQLFSISFGLVFFIMMSRTNQGFLPIRDYAYFIVGCEPVQQYEQPCEAIAS